MDIFCIFNIKGCPLFNKKEIQEIKKIEKITAKTILIIIGLLIVLVLGFHFWFRAHAEKVIADLVTTQSNGKLKLSLDKFKYNWLNNKIGMINAKFLSTDTTAAQKYTVEIPLIDIKTEGFLPMLFDKEFKIDSIHLYNPQIKMIRNSAKQKSFKFRDISVPYEIGRISDAINKAINLLKINRLMIDNGGFTIKDDSKPLQQPLKIDKIMIRLDNLKIDSSSKRREKRERKFLFSDNIAIQSYNQHIVLPNNRHIIDFKNFTFNIKNKRVEFDSCTLIANRGDSSKTSFNIFFKKLQLTNVNFDSLYHTGTLVADSVYCKQPSIVLNIDQSKNYKKNTQKNKPTNHVPSQKIDLILQQLLGDIALKHVIVDNADLGILIFQNNNTNSIQTANTNFEMKEFKATQNNERPISVKSFNLNLQDYDIKLQDGKYTISFDSLHLKENELSVKYLKFKEGNKSNLFIPTLQLKGLSWEELLYNQKLETQDIQAFQPNIQFKLTKSKDQKNRNIFTAIHRIAQIANIKNLNIISGHLNFSLPDNSTIYLENATLNISGNQIQSVQKVTEITNAIHHLQFDKIIYQKENTKITLHHVNILQNNNQLKANTLDIQTPNLKAKANTIVLDKIEYNDKLQSLNLSGVFWENASIDFQKSKDTFSNKHQFSIIDLRDIKGKNTSLVINNHDFKLSTYFNQLFVPQLQLKPNTVPSFSELLINGKNLQFTTNTSSFNAINYQVQNLSKSLLSDVQIALKQPSTGIKIATNSLEFIPNIKDLLQNKYTIQDVIFHQPNVEIDINHFAEKEQSKLTKDKTSFININQIQLIQPAFKFQQRDSNHHIIKASWQENKIDNPILIKNINGSLKEKIKIGNLDFSIQNASIFKDEKNIFKNDLNPIQFNVKNLELFKDHQKLNWKSLVDIKISNPIKIDSINKKHLNLDLNLGNIQNIYITSQNIRNWKNIITQSPQLNIHPSSVVFTTDKYQYNLQNLQYLNNQFQASSFHFKPLQSLEHYLDKKSFNEDYTQFSTGKIMGDNINISKLINDSNLIINNMHIDSFYLFSLKDKTQKDTNTLEKPFPIQLIYKIPFPIKVNQIDITNAAVQYQEKTNLALGSIDITDMNGIIKNIKNHSFIQKDSLHIAATGNINKVLPTQLYITQPYHQQLLFISTITGKTHFTAFNNVLLPFAGIGFKKGIFDSLYMYALADSNFALGNSFVQFKNLGIDIKNKNDFTKSSYKNRIRSWFVNHFIIRKNNQTKHYDLYFERNPQKSFINYIIKANLDGIAANMGVSKSKKKIKKIKKEQNLAR